MDDLERLVRELATVISEEDPARFRTPFQVSELYQNMLPYRSYKTRLGFDSSEDYDMAILRLLAGERGYASVEPTEVQEQLAVEAAAINPTPGLYREFAAARVTLNANAVALANVAVDAYAPPEAQDEHASADETRFGSPIEDREPAAKRPVFEAVAAGNEAAEQRGHTHTCGHCSQPLPPHRRVLFCPFCGAREVAVPCPSCGDEIERGWRFCITCGYTPNGSRLS
jgi:hypothetical protein